MWHTAFRAYGCWRWSVDGEKAASIMSRRMFLSRICNNVALVLWLKQISITCEWNGRKNGSSFICSLFHAAVWQGDLNWCVLTMGQCAWSATFMRSVNGLCRSNPTSMRTIRCYICSSLLNFFPANIVKVNRFHPPMSRTMRYGVCNLQFNKSC